MVNRIFFSLFLLVFLNLRSVSQDIHFSQFYMQPLSLSPALAGDYVGDMRFASIQRRQWRQLGAPVVTNGVSVEKKMRVYPNFMGIGLQLINDEISAVNLVTNKVHLSVSYMLGGESSAVHFGLSAGYVNRNVDFSGLTFPSQYNSNTGNFDATMANGESSFDTGGYMDFNAGILWVKSIGRKFRQRLGASFFHLNTPNEAFTDINSELPIRYNLHYTSVMELDQAWAFMPKIQLLYTAGAINYVTVLQVRKHLNQASTFYLGPGFRGYVSQNDAVIMTVGFELGYLELGFGYDWNVSTLSQNANGKTTVEFAAILRTPPKRYKTHIPSKKKLPCRVKPRRRGSSGRGPSSS